MSLIYNGYYKPIPAPFKFTGAVPVDTRSVVETINDLYGEDSSAAHTWEDEGNYIVYKGLKVVVLSEGKTYMCVDDAHPYDLSAWKCDTDDSAIHEITGELGITQNPNDEYVAVGTIVDSSNNVTLNSSVQLALPFNMNDPSTATGLATDNYVKDAIYQTLEWVTI